MRKAAATATTSSALKFDADKYTKPGLSASEVLAAK